MAALDRNAELVALSGAEVTIACDVTDEGALASAVEQAVAGLGGLDVVVAAAGIAGRGTVADTEPADWDRVLAVNLRGVYLTARAAIPHLRAAGGGAIVNIASQLGLVAAASAAAYCASKGAVISLTRAMAIDHGPEGIRVNCVCPGPTDTPLLDPYFGAAADPAAERAAYEAMQLHGRLVTPEEIAGAVAYLAAGLNKVNKSKSALVANPNFAWTEDFSSIHSTTALSGGLR